MDIVDKIGQAALLEQTAEECMELAKECLKMARILRKENPTPSKKSTVNKHLNEETADVLLCLGVLADIGYIPHDEVIKIHDDKVIRWKTRLGIEIKDADTVKPPKKKAKKTTKKTVKK